MDILIQTSLPSTCSAETDFTAASPYRSRAFGEEMSHCFLAKYSSFSEEAALPWDGYEIYLLLLKMNFSVSQRVADRSECVSLATLLSPGSSGGLRSWPRPQCFVALTTVRAEVWDPQVWVHSVMELLAI